MLHKIRYLIRVRNNISDNYGNKYLKARVNSDNNLPLEKALAIYIFVILVRFVSNNRNKYYP